MSRQHTHSASAFSISNRKIDPTRRRATALKADGTPDDNDRVETGPTALAFAEWAALGLTPPDLPKLRAERLARLRARLAAEDVAGILLFDPLNIRYATDSSNMQIWTLHNYARAAFVAADGPMVLWDFHSSEHLTAHLPLIDEVRHGASFFYFESGELCEAHARRFAGEIAALVAAHGGGNRRLAVDKVEWLGADALRATGLSLVSGQRITELARVIKSPEEIRAMRCAMASCEAACEEMRAATRPGETEVGLWAVMNRGNHIRGGEWVETRILSTGPRTNPWFQECGPRVAGAGELLAFDTDMIGPYGYCADISRTWLIGDGDATAEQRRLFRAALEHVTENAKLLRPGTRFEELTFGGHQLPEEFVHNRYGVRFHGIGLCDEYPSIRYREDYEDGAFLEEYGVLQPNMTLCVEVYVGAVGGREGVKIEDQWLVTETGAEPLTRLGHDPRLM